MATEGTPKQVGARIRRLRLSKGLSQRALGEPRVRAAYVSQIESGFKMPSLEVLDHIAAQLGVDTDELLTGRPSGLHVKLEIDIQEGRVALHAGRLDEAEGLFTEVQAAAARYEFPRVEAKSHEGLASVAERRGDLDLALERLERAQSLLKDDVAGKAEAVAGAARCYHMRGESKYAVHILEQYVFELRREEAPDPTALMRALASLSYFYLAAGFAEQAVQKAEEARALEPRSGDPENIACMNINLARILLHQRRESDALRALERAESVFRQLEWKIETARALIAQGFAFSQKENWSQAEHQFNRALDILVDAPSKFDQAAALNELGRVMRLTGDLDGARARLNEGLALLDEGDMPERGLALRELALTYLEEDPARAAQLLDAAVALYQGANKPVEVALTLGHLAQLHHDRGDIDAALRTYQDVQSSLVVLGE